MKRFLLLTACATSALLSAEAASAAVVTRTYSFTASNFTASFGNPIPYQTVTGSITLSFDNSQDHFQSSAGVIAANMSIPFNLPIKFNYYKSIDSLTIGGNGDAVSMTGRTNDFGLSIGNASGPSHGSLYSAFSYAASSQNDFYRAGSLTITSAPASPNAIPEPATWAMMIAGFGMAGGILRKRAVRPVLAS